MIIAQQSRKKYDVDTVIDIEKCICVTFDRWQKRESPEQDVVAREDLLMDAVNIDGDIVAPARAPLRATYNARYKRLLLILAGVVGSATAVWVLMAMFRMTTVSNE